VGRLIRRFGTRQRHQLDRFIGRDLRFAALEGLVAQQTFGDALLPAPHRRLADPAKQAAER
jgi:hypothetical protein